MNAASRLEVLPIIALFCACFSPYFVFFEANWQQIALSQTLQPLVGLTAIFIISLTLCLTLGMWLRKCSTPFLLSAASLIAAFFLYTEAITSLAPFLEPMLGSSKSVLSLSFWVLVLAVCLTIAYFGHLSVISVALSFYFIAGLLTPIVMLATVYTFSPHSSIAVENAVDDFPLNRLSGENVYWIVPDGYAGQLLLDQHYNFDNSAFLGRMADIGFTVMESRSNAIATHVSIASIFYLNYLHEGLAIYSDRSLLYPMMLDNASTPPFLAILRDRGYRLFLSGNTWSGCSGITMVCISEISNLSYASRTMLTRTPFGLHVERYAPSSDDAISPLVMMLPELTRNSPFFAMIHHLPPHPPHLLDRDCQPRTASEQQALDNEGYLEAIGCVNRMLEQAVQSILQLDPGAIIVIQSDHGGQLYGQWTEPMLTWNDDFLNERTYHMGMVLVPRDCRRWLRRDMGQINMARFVLGCLAREEPRFLEEKTMLTVYETSSEFGNVLYHHFD